jgi:5'-deoxynucleotidase YfbR-like HD superfamily hydrolase
MTPLERLKILRAGGGVIRYHTWPTLRQQRVSEHTFGVMQILAEITPPAQLSRNLLLAAMNHDVSELLTGDIPSPAKTFYPDLRAAANAATTDFEESLGIRLSLTKKEAALLKWADMYECLIWSLEEMQMGNRRVQVIVRNAIDYLDVMPTPNQIAADLLNDTKETYNEFCCSTEGK